ncbi:MAG TPA: AAA family ATPase [Smithella sp.]|nr:AAA family ATPase [Smithella sp.]
MSFHDFIGHDDAKLALILNAIDAACGGVLFIGEKGSGKSTLARIFRDLLPRETPFVNFPQNATEEALLGGIDLEDTLKNGRNVMRAGLFQRAGGGVIYIDDVNLLSPEIIALLLKIHSHNYYIADIAGSESKHPQTVTLVASMNPEEGHLSSHFMDRFGMCVLWEGLKEPAQKIAVMKRAMHAALPPKHNEDDDLYQMIQAARLSLKNIIVSPQIKDMIAQACIKNAVAGHRGDIFLFYAARAYAAFCKEMEVTEKHIDQVLPLVLLHRKRALQQMKEDDTQKQHHHDKPADEKNGPERDQENGSDAPQNREDVQNDTGREDSGQVHECPRESSQSEEIFDVGNDFKIRRLTFRKDRINRMASGRRTKTGSVGKRGRHIKSILSPNDDIAIDATIRAAAPFQMMRGRKGLLLISNEDLRFRKREKKMGHLVILVVDGSGSMGAQKRMVETKGAVQSLLMDCYQKRDKVSLIVFRKDKAEVVLPPTASIEMASRRLKEIPTGGKTPLTAGLFAAYNLIGQVRKKSQETRFLVVLVTDGRANKSLSDSPVRDEIPKMAGLLCELPSTDYIIIDTEDKKTFIKADLAQEIATMLGADYYQIDELKANYLTEIVQSKKATMI